MPDLIRLDLGGESKSLAIVLFNISFDNDPNDKESLELRDAKLTAGNRLDALGGKTARGRNEFVFGVVGDSRGGGASVTDSGGTELPVGEVVGAVDSPFEESFDAGL